MTIDFKEEQISQKEEMIRSSYIGYFAPNGELIDYNTLFGENYHDAWRNPVSWAFLSYISYIIKGTHIEDYKKCCSQELYEQNKYPGLDELVIRGYSINYDFNYDSIDYFLEQLDLEIEYHKQTMQYDIYEKFTYELLMFFKQAYCDKKIFDTIGHKIYVEDKNHIDQISQQVYLWELTSRDKECFYQDYLKESLMSHFKDICVQYLGYDSLERFTPKNEAIKIPGVYEENNFDFLNTPRVISSSYPNINERYYNYLLMNWKVNRLPRYHFSEQTKKFEVSTCFEHYQSDKEQILEKEIQSIKKLVPIHDRYKYFR